MDSNNNQKVDPQLVQILELLGKFGFKFFGYSENKEPLVIAENGQVVTVSVAYNFVQTQMAKASAAASMGNIETMPQMPQMPQMPTSPEGKVESKLEQGMEKQDKTNFGLENIPKIGNQQQTNPQNQGQQQVPQQVFGDGFKISSFNPSNIDQTIEFVKKNSQASQTSPKKYLAIQLEKFLAEIRMSRQNNKS